MNIPQPEERPIAVRAYAVPQERKDNDKAADRDKRGGAPRAPPSSP